MNSSVSIISAGSCGNVGSKVLSERREMTAEPSVGSGAWVCEIEDTSSLAFPFPLSIVVEVDVDGSRKSFPVCANSSSLR